MASIKRILLLIMLMLSCLSAEATTYINAIRFEGNDETREVILRKEIFVSEGNELDVDQILRSVQGIMDLGLFRSVNYRLEETVVVNSQGQNLMDVVFVVREKYYLLIIPRLKTEDNHVNLGVQLRWDNIGGLNHELHFLVLNRGQTSGIREAKKQLTYVDAFVANSDYTFRLSVADDNNVTEYISAEDENVIDQSFSVGMSKYLDKRRGSRGRFIGLGANYRSRQFEGVSSGLLLSETDAASLSVHFGYENVHRYLYNRGGKEYGYSLELSHHSFGSQSEFAIHNFYYRSYYRFTSRPDDNLNVQTLFSYATNDVLDEYAFNLGGSDDMRGYDKDRFEGNAQILMNIEYLRPDEDHKRLRYAVFLDVGNAYETVHDIKGGQLETAIGFGVRWKIPMFVKLDIRIDAGYGFADDDYRISASSRHAF